MINFKYLRKSLQKVIKISTLKEAGEECHNNPDIDLVLMDVSKNNININVPPVTFAGKVTSFAESGGWFKAFLIFVIITYFK